MSTPLEPVRLALYCTGCMPGYHLPCFAGDTQGIFRRHGLDVQIMDPEPGPGNILAADAGRYDLCLTSVAHFLNAKRREPANQARFVFMVARRTHMAAFSVVGRVASTGRTITSHADLDGATVIGDPESALVREYVTLLGQIGVSPGAFAPMPYEKTTAGLIAGEGDVLPDFLNLLPKVEAAGGTENRIRVLPFHEAGVDVYGSGLVAGRKLLQERPDVLQRAVAALRESMIVTREEPITGLEAFRSRLPLVNPDMAIADWQAGVPLIFGDGDDDRIGTMTDRTWLRTLDFFASAYGDPGVTDLDALRDTSFLSGSLAVAAAGGRKVAR